MWTRYTSSLLQMAAGAALTLLVSISLNGCATSETEPAAVDPGRATLSRVERADSSSAPRSMPEPSGANTTAFNEAVIALQAGDLATAQRLLRKVTTSQPGLAGPWINLGQVYALQDNVEDARLAFNQAIQANPDNCAAYNQLGVLSRKAGDFAGAEDHYRACIDRMPDYQDVYLNLGILYELYLGRLDDALAAYRRYQSLQDEPDRKVNGWVIDLERRLGV